MHGNFSSNQVLFIGAAMGSEIHESPSKHVHRLGLQDRAYLKIEI